MHTYIHTYIHIHAYIYAYRHTVAKTIPVQSLSLHLSLSLSPCPPRPPRQTSKQACICFLPDLERSPSFPYKKHTHTYTGIHKNQNSKASDRLQKFFPPFAKFDFFVSCLMPPTQIRKKWFVPKTILFPHEMTFENMWKSMVFP